jgi:sirohydrochlorin ferrochelatase
MSALRSGRDAPALLAISHGTSSSSGQSAVAALVAAVATETAVHVVGGHVDVQQPDVPTALASLKPSQGAIIVPLLLSAGYHVHVDLVKEAEKVDRAVAISHALGPDDRIVRLLARRLEEAGLNPRDEVILACAGSSDPRAIADCVEMAERLALVTKRRVSAAFISAAHPRVPAAIEAARGAHPECRIVLSTYLLAPGFFNDLLHAMDADVVSEPLLITGATAPTELVEVVLDRYSTALDAAGEALQRAPLNASRGT